MQKYEIALRLAQRYGYKSYLEICTPMTGLTFAQIDKQQFERRARLIYRCPSDFSDGEPVDFPTESESGEELFGELVRSGERFDLVFVDPWHTYASSLRDILFGLHLVKQHGVLLVHDCSPPNPYCAAPEYHPGEWCGVTFAAYLDVVLFSEGLRYVTIDSDYGCGVIFKDSRKISGFDAPPDAALASQWRTLNLAEKYSFLDKYRPQLLHLISPEEFCHNFGTSPIEAQQSSKSDGLFRSLFNSWFSSSS
jgi:hypothetical protein